MEEKKDRDFRIGFLVVGAIMVGVGVLFLAANFIPYLSVENLWPLFMLIPVAIMIIVGIQNRKKLSCLAQKPHQFCARCRRSLSPFPL